MVGVDWAKLANKPEGFEILFFYGESVVFASSLGLTNLLKNNLTPRFMITFFELFLQEFVCHSPNLLLRNHLHLA